MSYQRVKRCRYINKKNSSTSSSESENENGLLDKFLFYLNEECNNVLSDIAANNFNLFSHIFDEETRKEDDDHYLSELSSNSEIANITGIDLSERESSGNTSDNDDDSIATLEEPSYLMNVRKDESELTEGTINEKILNWAHRNIRHLTYTCINELLCVLRSEGHTLLPKSSKTLFATSTIKTETRLMTDAKNDKFGDYKYFDISSSLRKTIDPQIVNEETIQILYHVDGVKIYQNSNKGLWTIMGKIFSAKFYSKPFLIAAYYGRSKPKSVNEFFSDLIDEVNKLNAEGIKIADKQFKVKIAAFTADTPARAYIKQCKGHTGFFSCERCEIEGVTIHNKRIFPETNCLERSKKSFIQKRQLEHHVGTENSPLLKFTDFDPIKFVLLDEMHLLYLGVCKSLLEKIIGGKHPYSIGSNNVKILQNYLTSFGQDLTKEFQRNKFDLSDIANWKATQFWVLLLYASGLFFYHILDDKPYKHFMLLFTAVRILCSKTLAVLHAPYAKKILKVFFELMPNFYGSDSQIMNFHNLIHIADDVINMKVSLPQLSAFDFENSFSFIKDCINKSQKFPISQLNRKLLSFRNSSCSTIKSRFPLISTIKKTDLVTVGNFIEKSGNRFYFNSFKLCRFVVETTHPNNVVLTVNKHVIRVKHIFSIAQQNISIENITVVGETYDNDDLFEYPILSRRIGIYHLRQKKRHMVECLATNIDTKCIFTKIENKTVAISLLH